MGNATQDPTIEPVQMGGWYELQSGRVAHFTWSNGVVRRGAIVASWAEVPKNPTHPGYDEDAANKPRTLNEQIIATVWAGVCEQFDDDPEAGEEFREDLRQRLEDLS